MTDVDEFFDPADGHTSKVRLDGGVPFDAIFDSAYVDVLGVGSAGPAVTCKAKDVQAVKQGSVVEVNGTHYRVTSIEPDGTGITLIRLHTA